MWTKENKTDKTWSKAVHTLFGWFKSPWFSDWFLKNANNFSKTTTEDKSWTKEENSE